MSKNCLAGKKFLSTLNNFPDLKIKVLSDLENLENHFRQVNFCQNNIALFAITSETELNKLIKLKNLFKNTPILLILPNKKQMFSIGAKLYPRYMSDFDNSASEINTVLAKLIKNINNNKMIC